MQGDNQGKSPGKCDGSMKYIIFKIFYLFCGFVFLAVGLGLFSVSCGYVTPEMLTKACISITGLYIMMYTGSALLVTGGIFLIISVRISKQAKAIIIKDNGEEINIPLETIKGVISQILSVNPHISVHKTVIIKKGKWFELVVTCGFNDPASIRREIDKIKGMLKTKISEIFELPYFRIKFKVDKVRITSSGLIDN